MAVSDGGVPPILAQDHYTPPSAFAPENLLRETRGQKRITGSRIPDISVLDPDGGIVRSTNQMGRVDGDFEKGEGDGSHDTLQLIAIAADRLRSRLP